MNRKDFPILSKKFNGNPWIYLDNAATAQKPIAMIDRVNKYYSEENANIHRGVHRLSQEVTHAYEDARSAVQNFIHAEKPEEIIFTKGTTESINMVASSLAKKFIRAGDEIILSEMEHHSNILPWQMLCEERGAILKIVPVTDNGELDQDAYKKLIGPGTRVIAITHVSNTLGTVNPVKEMIRLARKSASAFDAEAQQPFILIDGAQAVPHLNVDVQDLDCDFYCFSGHKLYGPTGIGILYGKSQRLNELPPYQGGGGTIKNVTFEKTTYAGLPFKFEAGTPHIAGAIGLGTAIDYVTKTGLSHISAYEHELLEYATERLKKIQGLKIIGTAKEKAAVISFVMEGLHPMDIGTILDQQGIAVRTGHHCTQPLMERFGIPGTVRASFAFYNTREEIDSLVSGIIKAKKMLS